MAFLLLVAGNATVASMIALVQTRSWGKGPYAKERLARSHADLCRALQGVVTLLQHPEQLDELKADPPLAKGTVEELLRYHSRTSR